MRGLILAAGRGTRLGSASDGLPKCLVEVGGKPLIHHQLDALESAGVGPVLVVIGYEADRVRESVGGRAEYLLNPRYASTNSITSFLLARERLKGPFILLHGDMLFDPAVVERLIQSGEDALAYDSSSGNDPEEMKVQVRGGRLVDISKELPRDRTAGESVGMLYLGEKSAGVVFRKAEELVAAGRAGSYWAAAVSASAAEVALKAVDVAGIAWTEIDTPGDLHDARRKVWPRVADRLKSRACRKRILFAGSAQIHFVCFQPVYLRLAEDPRLEFWFSGGFKEEVDGADRYSLQGFYDPFPVDPRRVIPIEQAREEDFDVLVGANSAKSLLPRSATRKVQIFHGMSFRNFSAREKYLKFDFICLAGRYLAEIYRRNGLIRMEGQCLITGFAKDDVLVNGTLDRTATLRRIGLNPDLPTILFAPTGAKHNAMEVMGLDLIRAIREIGRWNLIVKLHDHPKNPIDWASAIRPLENGRVRHVHEPDIAPFIHAADLLISDASSVATEFTLLDRPIVFIDVPELFKEVAERGGTLDLETYGRRIGVVVEKAEDVVGAVVDGLAHPAREGEIRRSVARHVFHNPGHATERIAGVVLHAAGVAPSLPEGVEVLKPDGAPVASEPGDED